MTNSIFKKDIDALIIKQHCTNFDMQYYNEINLILLENNILQNINIINNINETAEEYKFIKYNLFNILQNILILNNNKLKDIFYKNKFLNIEKAIYSLDDKYNKKVLLKMLYDIKNNNTIKSLKNNINYRNIDNIFPKYPPIDEEERIYIEKTLPQFRQKKQFKNNPNIFKVDEIVGVKSENDIWNMGRVLHKFTDNITKQDWYYVKIEGTSDICNFWVNANTYRIQKFKARKHILCR